MTTILPLWALITFAAAFLQNIRSSLQKHLKGAMGTSGATFVRFAFGMPFAFLYLVLINRLGGAEVPQPNAAFAAWVVVAALGQIFAQALLIHLFSFRNFVVGSAYSRTEPVQAAIFGLLFVGETVSAPTIGAIIVAVLGVMLISIGRTTLSPASLVSALFTRVVGLGLLSGAFFGISAVAYRAASLSLEIPGYERNFLMQAAFTLCVSITLQTLILAAWIFFREREQFARIAAAWKISAIVGLVGATASFGWFAAFTLQNAAMVKTVAQVEMLLVIATSILFFKETITKVEIAGVALITTGIVGLLWAA